MEYLREGGPDAVVDAGPAIDRLLGQLGPRRRVLILPPDFTRFHSGAGELTTLLYQKLGGAEVLPATGTHRAMLAGEIAEMFPGVPAERFHVHDHRNGVVRLGDLPAELLGELSGGRFAAPVAVEVNRRIVESDYDLILSVGQVVPHEVAGFANGSKNVYVGCGGRDYINKSHFLSAVVGIENVMGVPDNPVRALLNETAARFPLPAVYLLTVRGRDDAGRLVTRGLFAGDDEVCFRRGAELSRKVNIEWLDRAPRTVVVWLDPKVYKSTWLGNKAIYRTRTAVADGGELIILAPGVDRFGETDEIDALIRRHGYRGMDATFSAVRADPTLADSLAAAAHLIHGSSAGRFTVTYCPGGLPRSEVEGVGYRYGDLADMTQRYDPARLRPGWNGNVYFVPDPGQGLWDCRLRLSGPR